MSKKLEKKLSDLLRDALVNRPGSLRDIEAATGVANPIMVRFVRGERDMKLRTAEALIEHFGIRVLPPKAAHKRRG